ncbi:2Fe-2S iron-sulfur cluster-binding protein, partial [Mycolicibacterium austroafricanum]|uniref:2Fe-2S iron-sulfur cluster-binding protein n=1 Tax=Mycolicibacterium austroafricanum TaxID=39687 RepID=UPI00300FB683
LQCGFCTPGFVTSITALLRDNPNPSDEEIREGLSGNFCRCTGRSCRTGPRGSPRRSGWGCRAVVR